MPEIPQTIFDTGELTPDQTITAASVMKELADHPRWPIFVSLLQREKIAKSMFGYVDQEFSKDWYRGYLEALGFSQYLPDILAARAKEYIMQRDERERNAAMVGGSDGDLS
jgi:hypothetical protein